MSAIQHVKRQRRPYLDMSFVVVFAESSQKITFAAIVFCKIEQVETDAGQGTSSVVHGSLMVALEHSSGAVRARAVKQLSRAISTADEVDAAGESTASMGGEDLAPALLRRLHDEDPEVVLAITGSDSLVQEVLFRSPPSASTSEDDDGATDVSDLVSSIQRAAVVCSASAAAAAPWLSALSEARPKHPVGSSGSVLCGLLRLAAAAAALAAAAACHDVGEDGQTLAKQARNSALSLFLECLPGPSFIARVKLAQQLASAPLGGSGDVSEEGDAASSAAAAAGKACKKALRAVSRAAIEAVSGLSASTGYVGLVDLFGGLSSVLEQRKEGENKVSTKSPSKNKRNKSKAVDAMEVEGGGKSKGLKVMGEDVCNIIASAFVGASGEEGKMEEFQVRGPWC